MTWRDICLGIGVVTAGCVCLAAAPQQQAPPFRAGASPVVVYATVHDADGKLVTNLSRDDFEILDNGKPQDVTLFANALQPITLIVMLDTSGSMAANLKLVRSATTQLITRLVPGDKARVGQFGDRIWINPDFTADVNTLIRFMWEEVQAGGPTPLWGALNVAMSAFNDAHISSDQRRVVLVFTDGYDTSSQMKLADVLSRAQRESFMIYAIGCTSATGAYTQGRSGSSRGRGARGGGASGGKTGVGEAGPDPGLRTLADETGGGYFQLKWTDDIGATFERVADELHHQYVLGFVPTSLDGTLHTIDVRAKTPGLTSRARKSYVATPPKLK